MSLDSFEYLLFLPLVFVIYWAIPSRCNRWRNLFLVVASYAFYAMIDWRFCGLLFALSLVTWLMGRWMHRGNHACSIATFNIVLCLLVLCYFKYAGFFVGELSRLVGGSLMGRIDVITQNIILPVGVSFYIFMAISYTIDRYKGVIATDPSLLDFLAYLSFFPHLLAGPIDRGREMLPQLQKERTFDYNLAVDGMRQILCGWFKKAVIADNLGVFVDAVWGGYSSQNSLILSAVAIAYAVQIYADFSGYSDMAIGTGKLLGLRMRSNFHYPYFSRNVSEFWRGWHQSLTTWFTEYLYIPLGGNRKGKLRTVINTLIVFTLCGLWHGANWTFVVWGALCGLLFIPLILNSHLKNQWKNVPIIFSAKNLMYIAITFVLISICWIFFRAPSVGDACSYIICIFTNYAMPLQKSVLSGIPTKWLFAILLCLLVMAEWKGKTKEYPLAIVGSKPKAVRWATYLFVLFCIFYYTTAEGAFIYQNF